MLRRSLAGRVLVTIAFLTTGTAGAQNAPFPPPTGLLAAQTSPTEITLTWRQIPGAVAYDLYAISGSETRRAGRILRSGNRAVRRIDEYDVPHVFAIEAVSENGTISERVRFDTVVPVRATPGPRAAPASVTAEAERNGIIVVRWTPVPGATAYMIGRGVAPYGVRMICSLCPPTPIYRDSATTASAAHVYTVVALSPSGPSRATRSGSVVPRGALVALAPARPPNAAAAAPTGTIRATPRPGSCLALGAEGNFIVRIADGTVRTFQRVRFAGRGPQFPKDPTLEPVPGISDAVAVGTSGKHWLVVRSDGTVLSWGASNMAGQLGGERTPERRFETPAGPSVDRPAPVRDITSAVAVAAGEDLSIALLEDGTIRTWGTASHGAAGDNSPAKTNRRAPTRVAGIDDAVAVAATGNASFALLADGTIRSWGWNRMSFGTFGVLGTGTNIEETNVPLPVAGISTATGVAASGGGYVAAVLADGTVRAWGFGYGDRPARGTPASNTPLPMDGIRDAVAISPFLALLRDGSVREFGGREWPWATPTLSSVVAVASDHVNRLALLADGRLMAWGHKQWYPNGPIVRGELGAETARQCAAKGVRGL